jgi:hypothetical protein
MMAARGVWRAVGGVAVAAAMALSLGRCHRASGPAEPGPLSPSANPPPPQSVQSGSPLQPGPAQGRPVEGGTRVNMGGAMVPDTHDSAECHSAADCVPAQCCHATTCVPTRERPACGGTMCTMECRPGTLDCGEARCACIGGHCGVQRRSE